MFRKFVKTFELFISTLIMAKNKKAAPKLEALVNDKNYIKSGRARNLPIYKCLMNSNWEEAGLAHVFVARQHVNGNLTIGVFLVDTMCVGVKSSFYRFNVDEFELYSMVELLEKQTGDDVAEFEYNMVHNVIFGALEFAEEFGISPDKDFEVARMILEEDDDNIPLIEFDFGRDGNPVLIGDPDDPATKQYLSILKRNVGEGNFEFEPIDFDEDDWDDGDEDLDEDDDDDPADWQEEDWMVFIKDSTNVIYGFTDAAKYFYKKVLMDDQLKLSTFQDLEFSQIRIAYQPIETDYKLSEEERREGEAIYYKLQTHLTRKQGNELEKKILEGIKKFPQSRIYYNHLNTLYSKLGDIDNLDASIEAVTKQFPEYLYGKLAYANRLIDQERLEEVPAVFSNEYSLNAIYPHRDTFHIGEMVAFHTTMCRYFTAIKDFSAAIIHSDLALGLEIPQEIGLRWDVFEDLDFKVTELVKTYLNGIRGDEKKMKEVIGQLVEDRIS